MNDQPTFDRADYSDKVNALSLFLDEEPDDITEGSDDTDPFEVGSREYYVLTDEEADERAREYILDTVWAFRASFLVGYMGLSSDAEDMIAHYQKKCEGANDDLRAMLKDEDHFVDDAITSDGRGHFISQYDGLENEQDYQGETFYIYRTN